MSIPTLRCIFCSSKYHTYRNCPMAYRLSAQRKVNAQAKQEYVGEAPNVFVGQYGYPSVNVGILNVEEYKDHDDPLKWSRENYEIPKIVGLRSSMINARHALNIKSPSIAPPTGFSQRFLDITKEVSLAKKPADVEIGLEKKPYFKTNFSQYSAPHGANVGIKKALLSGNTKIDQRLDKAASDIDLKATQALDTLYKKGIDEHRLVRAFSLGNFGIGRARKLVPTRWSITAVDDTLGKQIIREIKNYSESDCIAYIGGHLGNHYLIMFFDDVWQYELFEQFVPQHSRKPADQIYAEHDYEPYTGRKEYAQETAGGYYACRLGVLEKLKSLKRQSSVLAIRIITEEYTAPLGVWVVREAVRKALASEPLRFGDRRLMIEYAKQYFLKEFGYDITHILRRSEVHKHLSNQMKLKKWF